MSKQTLHFTLGDGLGAIMYDIAFEKLVYKNNFNAAIKSYTSSFPGMSVDLAKDIIIGKNVVVTNADNLTVSVQRTDPDNKPSYIIDLEKLLDSKYETLHTESIDYLYYKCWRTLQKWRDDDIEIEVTEDNWVSLCNVLGLISQFPETSFKIGVVVSIKVKDLVKSLLSVGTVDKEFVSLLLNYGDDEKDDYNICGIVDYLFKHKEETLKLYRLNEILVREFGFKDKYKAWFESHLKDLQDRFNMVILEPIDDDEDDKLSQYLKTELEYTNMKDIEPVDIADLYNAGFISPNGEVFAMNGDIANLLHCKIADKLAELYGKQFEYASLAERWLETEGWVKFHDGWILFSGREDIEHPANWKRLTEKQVEVITEYLKALKGASFGYRHVPVTYNQWNNMDELARERLFMY